MKRSMCIVALMVVASPASAQQQAPGLDAQPTGGPIRGATYVIDPTHAFVMYEIGHYGTTTNRGRFSTKDGSVLIDAN